MSQSRRLIETLKQQLKSRGVSYRALARELGVSEATIKRTFAEKTFTLERIEEICKVLGISFLELARAAEGRDTEESSSLTEAQEEGLAADPRLFAWFYILLGGLSPEQALKHYTFSAKEAERFLLKLDKLRLIELHPGNRVKFLVTRNVRWFPNGPLTRRYEQDLKNEFLNSNFSGPAQRLRLLAGRLSEPALRSLSRKIDKLITEFKELSDLEDSPDSRQTQGVWLLVAYRPWTFSVVSRLKR